jgi:hypothetical protein
MRRSEAKAGWSWRVWIVRQGAALSSDPGAQTALRPENEDYLEILSGQAARPGPPERNSTTPLFRRGIGCQPELFDFNQQIRTELGVGSLLPLCDQPSPNSVDTCRMPARSTTTIVEPFVAMQPVSAIPLIQVGKPSSTATISPSGLIGRR